MWDAYPTPLYLFLVGARSRFIDLGQERETEWRTERPGWAGRERVTVDANRGYGRLYIIRHLGQIKVADVTRADISSLMKKMSKFPTNANRVLSAVRKMFNMAEVWGMRRTDRTHAAMFQNSRSEERPG